MASCLTIHSSFLSSGLRCTINCLYISILVILIISCLFWSVISQWPPPCSVLRHFSVHDSAGCYLCFFACRSVHIVGNMRCSPSSDGEIIFLSVTLFIVSVITLEIDISDSSTRKCTINICLFVGFSGCAALIHADTLRTPNRLSLDRISIQKEDSHRCVIELLIRRVERYHAPFTCD